MILDKLANAAKKRVMMEKEKVPLEEIKAQALELECGTEFPFEAALCTKDISFICEVKKASPSKGVISEKFPYLEIAQEYKQAGAEAISVLTETDYFLGSTKYLAEIAAKVNRPVLRKDFTVDEYQIYEAKILGAKAVLLIVALLEFSVLKKYIQICDKLGLSALVEVHDEQEMKIAAKAGARLIGVNNRNLKDFTVDMQNSVRLRSMAPPDAIFVAESGIRDAKDIQQLRSSGIHAVLIGETLMRSSDKKKTLDALRGK